MERKEKAHLLPPSVLSRRSMLLLRFVVKKKKSEKCEITKHFHHPFLEVWSSLAQRMWTSWDGSSSRDNSYLMQCKVSEKNSNETVQNQQTSLLAQSVLVTRM